MVAFVLLCNSRFNFHCYTQCESTPTQKSARKWQLRPLATSCAKDYKGHSLVQTSFTAPPDSWRQVSIYSCGRLATIRHLTFIIPVCLPAWGKQRRRPWSLSGLAHAAVSRLSHRRNQWEVPVGPKRKHMYFLSQCIAYIFLVSMYCIYISGLTVYIFLDLMYYIYVFLV